MRALAAFSPDALSSIAYANQESISGWSSPAAPDFRRALPIGLVIVGLLTIVALSYFQTIHGYPSGGGSYVVARENLGTLPGLVAAAALLVGYLLTAAVSLTAGVEAIASAFPVLWPYRVAVSLVLFGCRCLAESARLAGDGHADVDSGVSVSVYVFAYAGLWSGRFLWRPGIAG